MKVNYDPGLHPDDYHRVDKLRLPEEWDRQPQLYRFHADLQTEAEYEHDKAKTHLELTEAEVELEVRGDPASFGLDKATEGSIKAAVIVDKRVIEAKRRLNEAKHTLAVHKAACRTIEQRKAALEHQTTLTLNEFYAHPRVKGEDLRAVNNAKADRAFGAGKRRRAHLSPAANEDDEAGG